MKDLATSLSSVQLRLAEAARRVGRDPASITLVAVTKTCGTEMIRAAYDLGVRHFGESRVEEAEAKAVLLPEDISWHMIGHIQSRKAKRVPPLFQVVHSVDSLELALRLDRLTQERPEPLAVLLEYNVSGDKTKFGFPTPRSSDDEAEWPGLLAMVEQIVSLPHLRVEGLMCMAPLVSEAERARPFFIRLRLLRDRLKSALPELGWHHLSMGMTDDFEVAVEEGATLVRIGRAIFAPDQPAVCTP